MTSSIFNKSCSCMYLREYFLCLNSSSSYLYVLLYSLIQVIVRFSSFTYLNKIYGACMCFYIPISKKKTKKKNIHQGLSKHQEVGFTPMTKVSKLIGVFWYLIGAIKTLVMKGRFHVVHMTYW